MKTYITALVSVLFITFATLADQPIGRPVAYGQKITVNANTAVPVRLSETNHWVRGVTILGKKSARTANTGSVYVGPESTDQSQPYSISTGSEIVITVDGTRTFDLYDWYLDVDTANDGVVILYY